MEPFMTDAEVLLSSLFSEAPSLWLDDLSNQDGKTTTKPQVSDETAAVDLFSELEQDSLLGDTDPLPEWMSEKVSLTSWLDVADTKPSELLMESSLPSVPAKLDLATTTTTPIPSEELLNTLVVDTRFAPQPPSPGEAQAPDLLALSPASSLFTDDDLLASSPQSSSIASPASPVENQHQTLELASENQGGVTCSLTTIDLSQIIQSQSPSSPLNDNVPLSAEVSPVEVKVVLESPEVPQQKCKVRPKVKSVNDPVKRKSKKRDQNKKAATRYRQKKRSEMELLEEEREGLEKTNKELNDKVDSISREIKYLKDLLAEVYKVKGEIKVMRKK